MLYSFARPFVPVLGSAETRQDYGTQLFEREMESQCLVNKYTVTSHCREGTRRRMYTVMRTVPAILGPITHIYKGAQLSI